MNFQYVLPQRAAARRREISFRQKLVSFLGFKGRRQHSKWQYLRGMTYFEARWQTSYALLIIIAYLTFVVRRAAWPLGVSSWQKREETNRDINGKITVNIDSLFYASTESLTNY